jgi:hypothetical protein
MRNRLRLLAAPVLAFAVVTVGLTVTAPSASATPTREVFAELFDGAPSATVPECNAAGTADVAAGRFDFYHCVTFDAQSEELEGFIITG